MKIADCITKNKKKTKEIICPACHFRNCRRHGKYTRKGFHIPNHAEMGLVDIPRFLCRNPDCPLCTFSILPPGVMRYCRFLWTGLLSLKTALEAGVSPKRLAENIWHVGQRVILRAAQLIAYITLWVTGLYQELTAKRPLQGVGATVKAVTEKIGRFELHRRWYRHRYPRRFPDKTERHTI